MSIILSQVHNCDVTNEVAVPKPLLDTQEPICPPEQTACADGTCIETALFCDGHPDCYDESGILIIQSNSIIVDSIIVENSKIVDDLAATKDFYLIKIRNSRNSKIVELFFGEVARNLAFFQ